MSRHKLFYMSLYKHRVKGSEPKRDTVAWYQDFEKRQKARSAL